MLLIVFVLWRIYFLACNTVIGLDSVYKGDIPRKVRVPLSPSMLVDGQWQEIQYVTQPRQSGTKEVRSVQNNLKEWRPVLSF